MVNENIVNEILEYLKKAGPTNTFKLAREMSVERYKLLNILEKLERKQAVGFKHGLVIFLEFPKEEKKTVGETHKKESKTKKVAAEKVLTQKTPGLKNLQSENKRLQEMLMRLEGELKNSAEERAQAVTRKELRLKSQVGELKKAMEELKQKAQTPPKVIKRIITKKVFVKAKEEPKQKASQFSVAHLMKNLQQLHVPEYFMQKITAGMPNLINVHKNIQQLNVPEIFKIKGV